MLDPTATFDHMIALLVPHPARREALPVKPGLPTHPRSLSGTLEYMRGAGARAVSTGRSTASCWITPPPASRGLSGAPDRVATFFSDKNSPAGSCPQRRCPRDSRLWISGRRPAAETSLIARVQAVVRGRNGWVLRSVLRLARPFRARARGRPACCATRAPCSWWCVRGSGAHRRGPGHQRAPGRRRLRATRLHRQTGWRKPSSRSRRDRARGGTRGWLLGWAGRARANAGVHGSFGEAAPPAGIGRRASRRSGWRRFVSFAAPPRPWFTRAPGFPVGETPRDSLLAMYWACFARR